MGQHKDQVPILRIQGMASEDSGATQTIHTHSTTHNTTNWR